MKFTKYWRLFLIIGNTLLGCTWLVASVAFAQSAEQNPAGTGSEIKDTKRDAVPAITTTSESGRISSTIRFDSQASRSNFSGLAADLWHDQKSIWTSPTKLRLSDLDWIVPATGLGAGLLATDQEFSKQRSNDPATRSHYTSISNAGIGALVGGAGLLWAAGKVRHNEHWSETGFLAGESAVNSLVMIESLKYSLRRQRPFQGDGSGAFFQSKGTSFPSEHAAAAWSIAGVIAHEYPGPLTKIAAYGLASFVSFSRVKARQHFPADVFVGGLIGNLVAQNIYSRHHDPELGGEAWRSVSQFFRDASGSPANQGSPNVPLDSWIYPALDRLASLGVIDAGFSGMRPWTRQECARLLTQSEEKLASAGTESVAIRELVDALQREFRYESESLDGISAPSARVESIYSRTEYISGTPLRDGYHFGQTQFNDFGRPFGEGWNNVSGFSAYATAGRWFGYVRGEWQTAPGSPALPLSTRQFIQNIDFLPSTPPAIGNSSVNQFDLVEGYVGLDFSNWQMSFGKQSLLWAPGEGGSLILGNNAPPINMFRINRATPLKLPGILSWLGQMRTELFLGQLAGDHFIAVAGTGFIGNFSQTFNPQPLIHGEKINFQPTPNFEFGFSRHAVLGGPASPFTLKLFLRSLFPVDIGGHSFNNGQRDYTGDQQSEMDWSYRLPKLRNWLTFYGDMYSDDQISPIAYWDRSAIHAGLYLSHVPGVPKLDLRVEGTTTDIPAGGALSHGFFYYSTLVPEGLTNKGYLLGSWIGREGQGAQAWTNYWFNSRNRIQLNFRHQKVSQQYLPGGGSLTDFGARGDYWFHHSFAISTSVQYERWLFPILQPNAANNVSATVQLTFAPQKFLNVRAHGPQMDGGRP